MSTYSDEPDDDELLTSWERNFMESIALWQGELTWAQEAKLNEIETALEERREAWRQAEEGDPGGNQRAARLFGRR
jgi:hypothetical protein